jgi:outer membrane protein TolC
MKNRIIKSILTVFLLLPFLTKAQEVQNIHQLFEALKKHPQTIADSLIVEKAATGKQIAYSNLYPKIGLFGTYDYASSPSAMLPVPPNDLISMVQDQLIPQPFSENIYRAGASISMPLFVKSIYTMGNKAKYLQQSALAKQKINLIQNEAIIVSANANLLYLDALYKALDSKRSSLLKTKELIDLKVKNGRAPGSSALIIEDHINEVETTKNQIAINREKAIASIQALTGIRISKPIQMMEYGTYQSDSLKSLEPLSNRINADQMAYRAEKEKLLPALFLKGNYNHSYAKAYNNDLSLNEDFSTVGLVLSIPVFNKNQYSQIKKSKIEYQEARNKYQKMRATLLSQADHLENSLILIERSVSLYTNSLKNKNDLLKIAKVSFESGRISIEDYLKYEDDLVLEKSKLYKAQAEKWQTLVKLAVIYGNNIENLIK